MGVPWCSAAYHSPPLRRQGPNKPIVCLRGPAEPPDSGDRPRGGQPGRGTVHCSREFIAGHEVPRAKKPVLQHSWIPTHRIPTRWARCGASCETTTGQARPIGGPRSAVLADGGFVLRRAAAAHLSFGDESFTRRIIGPRSLIASGCSTPGYRRPTVPPRTSPGPERIPPGLWTRCSAPSDNADHWCPCVSTA